MFCHVFLGDVAVQPETYEVCRLVEETAYVGARLQAKMQRKLTLPVTLLHLLQTELNKSFRQELERRQRVCWTDFEKLHHKFSMGNFRPKIITLPGAFPPQAPVARAPPLGDHTATPPPAPPTYPTMRRRAE